MNNQNFNENMGIPNQYDPSELQPFSNEKLRAVDNSNQNDNIKDYNENELLEMERYQNLPQNCKFYYYFFRRSIYFFPL